MAINSKSQLPELKFHPARCGPNKSASESRFSFSVSKQKQCSKAKFGIIFYFGHKILKPLGWVPGYDRVQFAETDDFIVIGRRCGQWLLSVKTSGHQATTQIAASRFNHPPSRACGIQEAEFEYRTHQGEKVLIVPSSKILFTGRKGVRRFPHD